jgi:quinolinate synthase
MPKKIKQHSERISVIKSDGIAFCKNNDQREYLYQKLKKKLLAGNVLLAAHYYTDATIQKLAQETGGIVADSLDIASYCAKSSVKNIIVSGVYFMGETVKILNPDKRVFMPTLEATCSLDLGCPAKEYIELRNKHPERIAIAYINTSAKVKAASDWVVTSRIAVDVVNYLKKKKKKILWAPDKHMATYLQKTTGADIVSWDGVCIVHDAFKVDALIKLKSIYQSPMKMRNHVHSLKKCSKKSELWIES